MDGGSLRKAHRMVVSAHLRQFLSFPAELVVTEYSDKRNVMSSS